MQFQESWSSLVGAVRELSPSVAGVLCNSNITKETETVVTIDVFNQFYKEQFEKPSFMQTFLQAMKNCGLPEKRLAFIASKLPVNSSAESQAVVEEIMQCLR